jgi:hypothetical protein
MWYQFVMKKCSIIECPRGAVAKGFCQLHYRRNKVIDTVKYPNSIKHNFWDCFDKGIGEDPCWNWTRSKSKQGYGTIRVNGKMFKVHRYSWILTYGAIPAGVLVCHRCDNTSCGNPRHLFLGTALDNNLDKMRKGRSARLKGEDNPRSSLSTELVQTMKNMFASGKYTQKDIYRHFALPQTTVWNILRGKTWKHIHPSDYQK